MKRIPELDGLRGIAVVTIMLFHLNLGRIPWGWVGVELFLVLSGYLITTICLNNLDAPGFLVDFYARRSLRIWPIYYVAILAIALMPMWEVTGMGYYLSYTQTIPDLLRETSILPGIVPPHWDPMRHTWSLAVEEQFYLLRPGLLVLCGRRSVIPLAVAAVAVGIGMRASGFGMYQLLTRCDGLAAGAILAAILVEDTPGRWRLASRLSIVAACLSTAIIIGLAAFGPCPPLHWFFRCPVLEIAAATLASFALVAASVCLTGSRTTAPLRSPWLCYLGTISYGLYLYHWPAYHIVGALAEGFPGVPRSPFKLALTMMIAIPSWYLIERPILRLKRHFDYRSPDRAVRLSALDLT